MGVKLPPNFAYKTLDVEYRCFAPGQVTNSRINSFLVRFQFDLFELIRDICGQVVITVEIPFPNNNYAPAIFTWKKMCGGSPPTHLNIVTSFDEQVVSAGVVSPEWAAVTGDHKVFPSDVETTFRLSKSRGARQTTRFDTPSVTAVTTSGTGVVCNPALDGSGRKGGTIRAVDKRAPVEIQVGLTTRSRSSYHSPLSIDLVVYYFTSNCVMLRSGAVQLHPAGRGGDHAGHPAGHVERAAQRELDQEVRRHRPSVLHRLDLRQGNDSRILKFDFNSIILYFIF